MIRFVITLGLLVNAVTANPLVARSVLRKTGESCLIGIDESTAFVSCSVDYLKIEKGMETIYLMIPVFVDSSIAPNSQEEKSAVKINLECEGATVTFTGIGQDTSSLLPLPGEGPQYPEIRKIFHYFEFKAPKSDEFTVVASYRQPLIEGGAYYLPLFEGEELVGDKEKFTITIFTLISKSLVLDSKHSKIRKTMKSRITLCPSHAEMIVARTS